MAFLKDIPISTEIDDGQGELFFTFMGVLIRC